jgi:hypothetical protein
VDVVGTRRFFRARSDDSSRIDLALGLLCVLLLPQMMQRADYVHIDCVELFAFALFPSALVPIFSTTNERRARWLRQAPALAMLAIVCAFVFTSVRNDSRLVFSGDRAFVVVRHSGRHVTLDDAAHAAEVQAMLDALDRRARPGESIFVGSEDLRRTNVNDVFVYFLVPELRPASYFTALVPGFTTEESSPLADQIDAASYLLLTTRYDAWNEPNASSLFGSSRPSEIVARDFCRVAHQGTYSLLVRCDRSTTN